MCLAENIILISIFVNRMLYFLYVLVFQSLVMEISLRKYLTSISEARQVKDDPSHDFQHILRVTNLAVKIAEDVGADLDVVIPAALFHDTVVYKKNSPQSKNESIESAEAAGQILSETDGYPREKIEHVKRCIRECSFSKGIIPESLESKVLQDADWLEATGAISIMRTFSSTGHMNTPLYDPVDPFCIKGAVNFRSGIDLFYNRLLLVGDKMHTEIAREIAKHRTHFLKSFLDQLRIELRESDII